MSECVGICDIDWDSGYCNGCGRSTDAIFGDDADTGSSSAQSQSQHQAQEQPQNQPQTTPTVARDDRRVAPNGGMAAAHTTAPATIPADRTAPT